MDGATLDRPVDYSLVRIIPSAGIMETRTDGRPWVIIDPRTGHGSGIGGLKVESEVGVALEDGHPVYFVVFYPDPAPTQTLANVTAAEAVFLQTVAERHPKSPKPLVTGNCQGGYPDAIVRMMVFLARARGAVRRERLERANVLLHSCAPFDSMSEMQRTHMIHEQSMIVDLSGKKRWPPCQPCCGTKWSSGPSSKPFPAHHRHGSAVRRSRPPRRRPTHPDRVP